MKTDWLKSASLAELPDGSQADTLLRPFLWRLMRGEDLTQKEAAEFFRILLDKDRTNSEQIAAALVALAIKGETGAELAGMAQVMRERAMNFASRKQKLVDIGGTGASTVKTFNASTAAAFVIAGAGLPVAKHCNRRVTSQTGSLEVLESLGVQLNFTTEDGGESRSREAAITALEGANICFLAITAFHGSINRISNIRSKLGIRTSLNLLGTLASPARPAFQIVGVWHRSLIEPIAEALKLLGVERAWVVHGADGLDEITLADETYVAEVTKSKINTFIVTPEDFGLQRHNLDELRVTTAQESAQIITDILNGTRRDSARSLVIINAAAALLVGGAAKSPIQAARLAERSIDSDSARVKLERLIMTTSR